MAMLTCVSAFGVDVGNEHNLRLVGVEVIIDLHLDLKRVTRTFQIRRRRVQTHF